MLIDLLFPKNCVNCGSQGSYFCEGCAASFPVAKLICPLCGRGSIGGVTHSGCEKKLGMDGLISIFPYKGGVQVAIKRLKYRFVREIADVFVEMALARVDEAAVEYFKNEKFRIVPVPLHILRERWRGFNQSALLGELISNNWSIGYSGILERTRHTDSLAELKPRLSREEKNEIANKYGSAVMRNREEKKLLEYKKNKMRGEQIKGAFRVRSDALIKGNNLLLLDDVWTSGATMLECTKQLKKAGAGKVWGLTLALSY